MNNMAKALTILFCCVISSAHGAIFHRIDTTRPLKCSLSAKHHNRILVDDGRIQKVIFPEEHLLVRVENISGQVFLQAHHMTPKNTTLSIINHEGLVQDLEITFEDKPAEVVILQEPISSTNPKEQNNETCSMTIDSIIDHIRHGSVPPGYTSTPTTKMFLKLKPGVGVGYSERYIGSKDALYVFQVKNTTCSRKCIQEQELTLENSQWVFLEKNTLSPKETILGIVSVAHHE